MNLKDQVIPISQSILVSPWTGAKKPCGGERPVIDT